jgi:hypothetical protein
MVMNKTKRDSNKATLAAVRKEMAKPRVAKSACQKNNKLVLKAERLSIRLH